jgi:predicted PurR-regulated permease PerM
VFTIALFVFYMTSKAPGIRRSVVSLLRPERQHRVLWAWNVAIEKTGAYFYQRLLLAAAGPIKALILTIWFVVYQQIENYVLEPRLSQKTMDLNPGIALGAAIAGGSVGGVIGAFFALPTAAAIQSFISAYATRYDVEDTPLTRTDEPGLQPSRARLDEGGRRE